jgi:magnesium transporter
LTIDALLYNAAGMDKRVEVSPELVAQLSEEQLLWIDVEDGGDADALRLARPLGINDRTIIRVLDRERPPYLDNYPDVFAFAIAAPDSLDKAGIKKEGGQLGFVVAKQWLLTAHSVPIPYLTAFKAQDKGETAIGRLSPALLCASLLDWHLTQYFAEAADIEASIDELDQSILAHGTERDVLGRIVAIRSRVSRLRAQLASQRPIFYGFSRPDFALNFDDAGHEAFARLGERFDRAIDEVERTRGVVVGSFELFTSITTQQTNDLVKALTFLTAVIGFCALIAGLFGMNFEMPLFKTGETGFSVVVGALVFLALISLGIAKWCKWV